ncbi:MAG: hypothetical protein IJ243_10825 [Prevotella sp.]|nr:hypothetical protein [Prevotella sp.]
MNQCARTFILVGLVVAILLALHFLPQLTIGDQQLRRVNLLSDVLPEVLPDDLDAMPEIPEIPEVPKAPEAPPSAPEGATIDSSADKTIEAPSGAVKGTTIDSSADTTIEAPSGAVGGASEAILDYSQGQPGGMQHFYHALASVSQLGRPVRVAYYGDSFIEGDIFTADLRELLQDRFGGNGVGWVDCASQVHGFRTTVGHTFSGIHEYEVVKRPFNAANQGIAQRYFTVADGARITYKGSKVRRHLSAWDQAIFYLRSGGGLTLKATFNGDTTVVDSVPGSQNLQAIVRTAGWQPGDSLQRPRQMTSASYTVSKAGNSTLLFGVALEPKQGVVVDNFSMRGSAGYTLSQIPAATLAQFAAQRPYDLIVLHFGLNVANSKQGNYSGYTRQMGQAIDHLRQAYPQASILIVSMPDRDQRTDAGLRTMKGVEQLVAYQQLMASEHAVSFFSLFQAMGGSESMKDLVDRGLANKDYTHINFKGGRYLARFLFDALMAGYEGK